MKIINHSLNKKRFKINHSYEQWLKKFIHNPDSDELNKMHDELNKCSYVNNENFEPIQGV